MLFDNLKRKKVSKREGCLFFVPRLEVLLHQKLAVTVGVRTKGTGREMSGVRVRRSLSGDCRP
jgi:hypothetical protein